MSRGLGDVYKRQKRRRSTRTKKDDAGDGDAKADAPSDEDKPKRRRSTRTKQDDAGSGGSASQSVGDDGEPQGIWGRFRSARKPRTTAG